MTLSDIQPTSATACWRFNVTDDVMTYAYRVIVCPQPQQRCEYYRFEIVLAALVGASRRVSYAITPLREDTLYEVFIYAVSDKTDAGDASNRLVFRTPKGV